MCSCVGLNGFQNEFLDCSDVQTIIGANVSGVYYVYAANRYIPAYCNMTIAGGGWTVRLIYF
jgi:hypothetical protein